MQHYTRLIARYLGGSGEVKVVFLVLNMGQNRQKQAAKMAAISNPRRCKDNSQSRNVGDCNGI